MKYSKLKLLETVADIAYMAGQQGYYSGDSRRDMADFIFWAKTFQKKHRETEWEIVDYILLIEEFTNEQLAHNLTNC